MSLIPRFVLAGLLSIVLAEAAHAVTISTPPVVPDDDGTFFCLVTNVSAKPLDIRIDVVDVNGGTSTHFGFNTPPRATRAALGRGALSDRFCQITIDAGRSAIRASVEVQSSSAAIEAVYPVP